MIVLFKGKVWTGLVGMFITPLLLIGAIRLSRPHAPWARWRYTTRPRKMHTALERERKLRPIIVAPSMMLVWIFGPNELRAAVPILLVFLVAVGLELNFLVGGGNHPQAANKETISSVSNALTSMLSLDQIIRQVVHTIRQTFYDIPHTPDHR